MTVALELKEMPNDNSKLSGFTTANWKGCKFTENGLANSLINNGRTPKRVAGA